jgi:ribosomal protein L40E
MKPLLARIPRRRRRSGAVPADGDPTPIAGIDPASETPSAPPSFRDRGRLRRRLRYLRRVRELGFRDLGGLVFDQHRFNRPNEQLVRGKVAALQAVDSELRALEGLLDDRRPIHELREPGVAACLRCGALHGSDARFCPSCGVPLAGPRAVGEIANAPAAEAATRAVSAERPPAPAAEDGAPAEEQPTQVAHTAAEPSVARDGS